MEACPLVKEDLEFLSDYGLRGFDLSRAERRVYLPGEYISRAGEPMDCIFFILNGKAKVFLTLSSGKQLMLAYFVSKGIIGDIELMTEQPFNYTTVQAVIKTECIALPLKHFTGKLRENIVFVNHIAKELAEKLVQRVINGAITTLHPIEARICAYILHTADNGIFNEVLTETADVAGASYRHLLRLLDKLCVEGVLRKEDNGFRVMDFDLLNKRAGDLYI